MNDESAEKFKKRCAVIKSFRRSLENSGFMEVETPMLHPIAGGALAKPFTTHHNALNANLFLRIAPELYLKKLIIGGVSDKIFELNRCFRNEGVSHKHNPEFTSIEIYQAYVNFNMMIQVSETLINGAIKDVLDSENGEVKFGDKIFLFPKQWPRKSMALAVLEETGVDFSLLDDAGAQKVAADLNIAISDSDGWGKILSLVFEEKVEHKLIQPIHITEFPKEVSPLAKSCPNDIRITERFESYVNGWEICNGFSELNDPVDQLARFQEQANARAGGDEEAHPVDYSFIDALNQGMPPVSGLGIGIDRLVMLLTNSNSIKEVIAFPAMRQIEEKELEK